MVDGVLHNACLRMAEGGDGIDRLVRVESRRRWFGRSGLAVGGAASLAVGAVLGGVLEGVPVLLAPPTSASALPQVVPNTAPAYDTAPVVTHTVGLLRAVTAAPVPQVGAPAGGGLSSITPPPPSKNLQQIPTKGPSNTDNGTGNNTDNGTGTGTGTPPGGGNGQPDPISQTLSTVSGVASQLPVVGSTASGVVGQAGGAVSTITSPSPSSTPSLGSTLSTTTSALGI